MTETDSITDPNKLDELLSRGVDKIYPTREELEGLLKTGKKLRLYQGFDPTGDKLHLGHMVGLRKLADWQSMGHHVIFVIGDGTGQAGDPSGKTTARQRFMTRDELRQNARNYVKQASKLIKFDGDNPVEVLFNGDWLNELRLPDILELAGFFSWQQLAERDLFQERIRKGETLSLREALYPLLQAYDSVAMQVDLEVGGSDQTFNMLAGRMLVERMLHRDKFVMTTPLLADASGRKIGKTEGNAIALTDAPSDLYGKIMSLPDEVIVKGFEYLTRVPMARVREVEKAMTSGDNPMTFKKELARQIVADLHSEEEARTAENDFAETFSKGGIPTDIETVRAEKGEKLVDILIAQNVVESKTEWRRLVDDGAVRNAENDEKIASSDAALEHPIVLKVGKRRFIRIDLN